MLLSEFLNTYEYDTCAHVVRVEWKPDSALAIDIAAYPFWLAPEERSEHRRLRILLRNIVKSLLS